MAQKILETDFFYLISECLCYHDISDPASASDENEDGAQPNKEVRIREPKGIRQINICLAWGARLLQGTFPFNVIVLAWCDLDVHIRVLALRYKPEEFPQYLPGRSV